VTEPSQRDRLADTLRAALPLTAALGVEVIEASLQRVQLRLPLAANLNHEHTAFGGSIASAGMLAAWGLLWLRLPMLPVERPSLVIAESHLRFIRPIADAFDATAEWPATLSIEEVAQKLRTKHRCRLPIRSELTCRGKLAAAHDGTFVIQEQTS
jgi:thioesterase domain-containing protein